ncbi:LDLR chaperone boca [Bombus vosnesenskii]|uniref:LDLR chaperone boca n=2 Tax=Pyrobombus TaxID=144703 RepID=A0A6J3K689_9HYME|nr:LDLR chaperone boca [Bombus vancouverensis nearcticus]XP_033319800.1 LDLR chaperone boca [Bombus bifarius]XP_033348588.1 LDLR chaperone boca [Bombus vosnesenskii]XP_050491167.1 LDLR chaperone boca [Bombus huntii]
MRNEIIIYSIFLLIYVNAIDDRKSNKKKSWRDKDIRDMNDADLELLLDQWEENDEPLEPDELPEHLRPSPKIDLSKLDMSNPDNVLKVTKKGKSVMMFVDTNEDLSVEEAETIMKIWQTSLQNNHIIAERYPIDQKRSVFLFHEGSQAVDAKNFFLEQPELSHVTLEGQTYFRDPKKQNERMAKLNKQASKRNIKKDNSNKQEEL